MTRTMLMRAFCLSLVVALTAACSQDTEQAKRQAFEQGKAALGKGAYPEAILHYRRALQFDAKFGEARAALADAYVRAGDLSNAYREYQRAADLLPDNVDVQIKAASFLLANEQFEDAKERIQKAIFREPQNPRAQVILGNAMAGLKDFESALEEMEKAARTDPSMSAAFTSIADVNLKRGDLKQAEDAFRRAIDADPKSVLARLSLANFLWTQKRTKDAEQVFREAVTSSPSDAVANRAMAAFLLASSRASDAEPFLRVAAQNDDSPGKAQTFDLVDYYVKAGKRDRALELLRPLEADRATASRAKARRGYLLFTGGQTKEGSALVAAALKDDPGNVETLVTQSRLLASEKNWAAALESAKRATEADPKYAPAWFVAGSIYADSGDRENAIRAFNEVLKLAPRSYSAKMRLARAQMASGNLSAAVSMAEEAASLAPEDGNARLTLAQTLLKSGNLSRAEPLVESLVRANPNNAQIRVTAGVMAARRQQWDAAEREYRRALELDPGSFDAFSGLIGVQLRTGKTAVLKEFLEQHIAKTPNDAAVLIASAKAYLKLRELERGRQLLERAVASNPSNLDGYATLGQLLVAQGNLDSARAHFEQLTTQNPKSAWARTVLGIVLEIQRKREDARKQYEEALSLDSNAGVAANNLATIYADSNERLDVALDLAQLAVRQMPEVGSANDTLGWVHYKRNTPWLAISPLLRAVQLEPKNPLFHYHLGLSYEKNGDKSNARMSLERAVSLGNFPGVEDARRLLASL